MVKGVNIAYERGDKDRKSMTNLLNRFDPHVAKNIDLVLGSDDKQPTPPEVENMVKTRKSIVPTKHIPKYTRIPEDVFSVWEDQFLFKRPGNGLPPKFLYQLLGKNSIRDLDYDEQVSLADFT